MELEAKRTMLRHYIRKIEVNPDKTGKIIYDPAAMVTFRSSRGFPQEDLFRPSNGCGGANDIQDIDYQVVLTV